MSKLSELKQQLEQWEKEGYDVSGLKAKWYKEIFGKKPLRNSPNLVWSFAVCIVIIIAISAAFGVYYGVDRGISMQPPTPTPTVTAMPTATSSGSGEETVYSGLEQAYASLNVAGNVYALGDNGGVTSITFQLKSVLASETINLGQCVMNYQDDNGLFTNIQASGSSLPVTGLTGVLDPNEIVNITVYVSDRNLGPYDHFTIEIIPPTGASIQIMRHLPGEIAQVMNLY